MDNKNVISTKKAAERLGVSMRQVRKLCGAPCPKCRGEKCDVCFHTGARLPAERMNGDTGPWMIIETGLELPHIVDRKVGKPKKETNDES